MEAVATGMAPEDCDRAEQQLGADGPQCTFSTVLGVITSGPLLKLGVSAPSKAWRFLQGASPCQGRSSQPPVPSVASVEEVEDTEQIR